MTNWLPDISDTAGPLYIAIADAIEKDIDAGTLSPGTKLPPQRNVAFDIGVTIGTISRGYALACERGLVSGEVGRGTYVLDRSETENFSFPSPPETSEPSIRGEYYAHESPQKNTVFNLGFASAANVGQAEIISRVPSEVASQLPAQIVDYVRYIPDHWLEAGCKWIATKSWKPERNTVVPVSGAHAGIIAILTTVTNPGDKIVFEGLTYSSIARSTALLGRRIITAKFDEYGLIPEELEKLCAQQHPKLLYL
ncbi:MAG: aminotransferase class I/II-fold pyridoxal phosphate-dependent enzyme, partial [Pseudomonadota bacterium]